MVIWLKFSPRVHFSLLILKMLMLPLAISYLATSNSPWFMDLIVYAILFFAELDFTSMTRHISSCAVEKGCLLWPIVPSTQRKKLNIVFALAQLLHPFWSYQYLPSSLPCSTSDIFWPGGFQYHIFLPFRTLHGVLAVRILEWFASLSSGRPHFVTTLHCDPLSQVALHIMALGFTELCKPLHHDEAVIYEGVSFLTP